MDDESGRHSHQPVLEIGLCGRGKLEKVLYLGRPPCPLIAEQRALRLPSYQGYSLFPTCRMWHELVPSSDERCCKRSAAKRQQSLSGTHDEVDRLLRDHLGVFTGVVHRTTAIMVEHKSIWMISKGLSTGGKWPQRLLVSGHFQRSCLQKQQRTW